MTMRLSKLPMASMCLLFAACLTAVPSADAQQRNERQRTDQRNSRNTTMIPSSEQLLEVRADAPEEVEVGEGYQIKVLLRNNSESVDLHDIKLEAKTTGPLEVQSSKMNRSDQESKKDGRDAQESASSQSRNSQSSSQDSSSGQSASENASDADSNGDKSDSSKPQSDGQNSWTIKKLAAGESLELVMEAVGDAEKEAECCLTVKSFRITPNSEPLCTTTKFTKPMLKLTKQAPERATLCDVVHFTYVVKNDGSGDVGAFTITDKLPKGFETESGDKELKFEVDGLRAGSERKFEADVRPLKIGDFSSRAVAKAKNSDLKNQSKKVSTKVEGADLEVAIDGPESAPAGKPVEYTVSITNNGNQAVEEGMLEVTFPTSADLNASGDFQQTDNTASNRNSSGGQPKPANNQSRQRNSDSASGQRSSDGKQDSSSQRDEGKDQRKMEFTGLNPGDTLETKMTLEGVEAKQIQVVAKASHTCRTSDGEQTLSTSEANTQTKIVKLPALRVSVVDEQDPIQVGEEVAYKIVVFNQGNSADSNLQLSTELPEGLKFKEVSGETSAEADGRKVTFEKVSEIQPGDKLEWTLYATAESSGEVRLKLMTKSDGLEQTVQSQEPTQLYGSNSQHNESQSN